MKKNGNLIVISGPSGVGKSTLVKKAMTELPDLCFSVSCTTRSPRDGEVHGQAYYFLSDEEFSSKLENNEFLEHAEYVGNYYGTPVTPIKENLAGGKDVIVEIEVQGFLQITKKL